MPGRTVRPSRLSPSRPMDAPNYLVPTERLWTWICHVLAASGLHSKDAKLVANNLMEAELRGVHSHGLLLLQMYVQRIQSGGIRSDYRVEPVLDHGAMLVLQADGGPGQAVMVNACNEASERALKLGVSIVHVINNNHVGMLATYARILAEAGLASMVMTTAGPSVFAFGGAEPAMGNNAFCYGAPSSDGPLIFDMATAVVACGKIRYKDLLGESVPEGWAASSDRQPSTSSRVLDHGGGVLPLGHKGFGIACMVDIFAGLLASGRVGMDVARQRACMGEPTGCSQMIVAMRPASGSSFPESLAKYADRIRDLRSVDPAAPVEAPGDPEAKHSETTALFGIALAPALVEKLHSLGDSVGYPFDAVLYSPDTARASAC